MKKISKGLVHLLAAILLTAFVLAASLFVAEFISTLLKGDYQPEHSYSDMYRPPRPRT